jgi:glycosyltransferase involved in cell wall biosynthesis
MKLVLATPLYPPDSGGPATYAEALVQGLPSHGIEVLLVKFGDVRHLPKVVRHFVYFRNILRATAHADVVLALDPVSVGFPAMLAAKLARKKLVLKIVGDFAWEQGTQRYGIKATLDEFVTEKRVPTQVRFLRAIQNSVARSAVEIIVPSEYLKRIVSEWGVSPEKITVIHNSIEIPEEILHTASQPLSHSVVSAGRLVPWKKVDGVIEAVKIVREQISDVQLTIVGDGPDRVSLEEKAKESLDGAVTFTGSLSHVDTLKQLQRGSVFVLNSSYEGLSHLLIEALMLGCAIIATNAGGNSEVITDEESGLLVSVGDTDGLVAALVRFSRPEMLMHTARLLSSVSDVSFK